MLARNNIQNLKTGRKWRVALIHSSDDMPSSLSSLHNCLYIALSLQATGMAEVTLVSERRYKAATIDLAFLSPQSRKLIKSQSSLNTVDMKDIQKTNADLYIFALNPGDLPAYADAFIDAMGDKVDKPIFNLVRGVQEDFVLQDRLKGAAIVNGILGCDTLIMLDTNTLTPLMSNLTITMERLNKTSSKLINAASMLLESTKIKVMYRKGLTSYSWGVVMYEHILLLSILSGETVYDTARDIHTRRIIAYMLFETQECLKSAGERGKWKPSLFSISYLSPEALRLLLLLPNILFDLVMLVRPIPLPKVCAAGRRDLEQKRRVGIRWNLDSLIGTADKHSVEMPLTIAILKLLKESEDGGPTLTPTQVVDLDMTLVPGDFTIYMQGIPMRIRSYTFHIGSAILVLLLGILITHLYLHFHKQCI